MCCSDWSATPIYYLQKGSGYEADPRLSFVEGARDVAVLEAMIESGTRQGALVQVKKF